jgi:hypothetical protein
MRVRIKTWLATIVGLMAFGAVGGSAIAQCGTCQPAPPSCCQAPPPPTPPSPPSACCEAPPPPSYPGGNGNFNVNVNVNVNGNANANANANAGSLINAHGSGDTYINSSGGAYFSVAQPYPTVIEGLNVEGAVAAQVVRTPFTASRWMASRVVIQAVCIDDRDIPHPASQVQPGRDVANGYDGELYRCIAGTRLQVTWADYVDQISFDHGQTMSCQKGESLWYGQSSAVAEYAASYADAYAQSYAASQGGVVQGGAGGPVGGGVMECRPQKPERDCNERSLLRRYGAGVKILTMWRQETYTEYREETVQASSMSISGASMTLDGGVGGRVF